MFSPPLRNHSSSNKHTPNNTSSFLSLRREKDSATTTTKPGMQDIRSTSYFEEYPRPSTNHPSKSRTMPLPSLPRQSYSHEPYHPRATNEPVYAFPTLEPTSSQYYSRSRSRTGPSGRHNWDAILTAPHMHFSGSSSTQHTETPPHTPLDYTSSRDSLDHFPVVVAAPIAGVETMDALVDGMNSADIMGGSLSSSSRSRYGIPNNHPLYQPPLPTPPPGIVLGGGKTRRLKSRQEHIHSSDSSENDERRTMPGNTRKARRRARPSTSRTVSNSTITSTSISSTPFPTTRDEISAPILPSYRVKNEISRAPSASSLPEKPVKTVVPSISDIIRNYAPKEVSRVRPTTPGRSASLYTPKPDPEELRDKPVDISPQTEDGEGAPRSSLDSIADEIHQTIKNQVKMKPITSVPPSSFLNRHSTISDNASIYSPRSDPGGPSAPSINSSSASYYPPSSPYESNYLSTATPSQAVAQYLRSARLTTLLKLTRSPHASTDNPLTVSLSDLGSKSGHPIVVFLGLGCVRHIMGLYDEMAECMNLRIITIDRWGLGRTEPRRKSAKGIMQWAHVVEEVLDLLHIDKCSVMAHSAGAPYALSFANKLAHRIHGEVCLLAPWVGGSENNAYKWLKYVPNSLLKTAQAADWKLQAWMIGKPPTIAYEGIGYTPPKEAKQSINLNATDSPPEAKSRPSMSSAFSEYDDLGDFDGRFESRSTIGGESIDRSTKHKSSRGFLNRFRAPASQESKLPSVSNVKKLKGLRSMGSLKGKNRTQSGKSEPASPVPPSLHLDLGFGSEYDSWADSINLTDQQTELSRYSATSHNSNIRPSGYRSISFSSPKTPRSMPSSPVPSTVNSAFTASMGPNGSYQIALSSALIAASHAESAKGTHNDLLQILNHDNHPWGFSYSDYPHVVRVWYGDRDEKIAENAVRWMERTMGYDNCIVKVVKGADHGLMYRSSVVIEVFERLLSEWRSDSR